MALSEQEKAILDYGKQNGKSLAETKAAIAKYRQENPVKATPATTTPPVTPTPTLGEDASVDRMEMGQAIDTTLKEGTLDRQRIRERVATEEITPIRGALQTLGQGLKTGFQALGQGAIGLAKMALPQSVETRLKETLGADLATIADPAKREAFVERLKTSEFEADKKAGQALEDLSTKYKTDETFRDDVNAAGGFAEAVGSMLGLNVANTALKTRKLAPEIDTPYFQSTENAVAEAIDKVKKVKADVSPVSASVPGTVPLSIQALGQTAIDKAVIGGQKIAETYRDVVENSTQRISANLDRQAIQANTNKPLPEVEQAIGDMYVNAVSPGVKGKKQSLAGLVANKDSAVSAVKNLTESKQNLKFRDIETNEFIEGELPTNLWEFGGAIAHQKSQVYKQITEQLEATGDKAIDITRITDAMTDIIENPVYANETAIVNRARESLSKYMTTDYTPSQIEELIQLENDRLQAFYRGAGTQADAIVSAIVANNLRDLLDEAVESATGTGVKDLKAQYGNLKAIERDVVHRALHNAQAREAGMVDMFGIRTIGDVAAGASGDLGALKRGAAQIAGESFIKALNDRDAMVNRMFLVAEQAYKGNQTIK